MPPSPVSRLRWPSAARRGRRIWRASRRAGCGCAAPTGPSCSLASRGRPGSRSGAGRGTATVYVYADNHEAWGVPDFLPVHLGLVNGGMEDAAASADDGPGGWVHDAADALHRAAWSDESPHGGKRCLKTVVAADA